MSNNFEEIKKITFADTEEEAERRFKEYATRDPLPDVLPALLNSADIQDYVAITGMIFPFHPEAEKGKLKTASYEVDLLGEIIYWEEDGAKKTCTLRIRGFLHSSKKFNCFRHTGTYVSSPQLYSDTLQP